MRRIEIETGANGPVLRSFMACRSRVSIIIGPLGSGKTYGAAQRMLDQMCEQKPNARGERLTRWLVVRNVYPELMATTAKDFEAVFEGLGRMKYGGMEPPTFHVKAQLPDGTRIVSEVIFLALDRDDAIRKLRGFQVTGVWLNECKELQKAILDMADLRHGRYPSMAAGGVTCTWHGILGDCNAPDQDHWLYQLAEEERPEDWVVFKQPGGVLREGTRWVPNEEAENLEHLPEGYYVRGMQGKTEDWIRVMLGNEYAFLIDGRPVHPEYVDSIHGARDVLEPDPRYELVVGVDFGRTPAAIVLQHWDHRSQWAALDELGGTDMSAAIFGPELKRWLERHYAGFSVRGFGDPAGEQRGQATEHTPIEIMRAAGIPIAPAPSNRAALRRAAIAGPCTRLGPHGPGLIVSPKAKMFRKGLMGGFQYRRMKLAGDDRYTDEPDKNVYSHYVEAGEYGMLGGGEMREALRPKSLPRARPRAQDYAIMDDTGFS